MARPVLLPTIPAMLYIHIPYCAQKCIYCDFYSGGNPDWNALEHALCQELRHRLQDSAERDPLGENLTSIYFGGGTPSLMPPDLFMRLTARLRDILAGHGIRCDDSAEITIEVNPEDVDMRHIEAWMSGGVNRVSMGIQTLDDTQLKFLRRRHSARRAIEAASLLRENFGNINLDIMYGIPRQTLQSLEETLRGLLNLKPDHISAYSLMYEERTPLTLLRQQGKIREADDSLSVEMYRLVSDTLRDGGLCQYEISNYAREGYESRHNSGYWHGKPYLGIGPSACSFDGNQTRRANPADIKGYLSFFSKPNQGDFYSMERLTEEERCEETIFTALRTMRGIPLQSFRNRFGEKRLLRLMHDAGKWIDSGDLVVDGDYLHLTQEGIMRSDAITVDLI